MTDDPVEVVQCGRCGKVLRRRRRLSEVERAQALAWRWAAAQFARDPSIERVELARTRTMPEVDNSARPEWRASSALRSNPVLPSTCERAMLRRIPQENR